jgi:hypothetical protein
MKILRASVVLIALFSAPAFAQDAGSPHINLLSDGPSKSPEEIEKAREVEKAYKDTLKTIPNAAGTNDPWGNVRSESQPKSKAKTGARTSQAKNASAKPKARAASGSTTN